MSLYRIASLRRLLLPLSAILATVAIAFNLASAWGFTFWQPAIVCKTPVWDIGFLIEGSSITHSFVITNTGGRKLFINRLFADCRCVSLMLREPKREIAPGASIELLARVALKEANGRFEKHIGIISNDPITPHFTLTIIGELKPAGPREPESIATPAAQQDVN